MDNGYRLLVHGDSGKVADVINDYNWRTDSKESQRHYRNIAYKNSTMEDDDVYLRIYIDDLSVLGDLLGLFGNPCFHIGLSCVCESGEATTEFCMERFRGEHHGVVVKARSKLGNNAEAVERAATKAYDILSKAVGHRCADKEA